MAKVPSRFPSITFLSNILFLAAMLASGPSSSLTRRFSLSALVQHNNLPSARSDSVVLSGAGEPSAGRASSTP
ncbi:hypothetical protein GGX14DRAFT_565720 [Mycena pura]|uniref:Secreted protein n=1 Tax=Mycena pura TaxID=153505 RepID=A0AAD6VLR7_9AGAR|nr:hypothetical protein GGX14DRAFT_565720 [Mycena pura]